MQTVYVCLVTIWIVGTFALMCWDFYLSCQMLNYRTKKWSWFEGRKFTFQTDPADYTETGQAYRLKSIHAEIALFIWVAIFFIALITIHGK